jgi:hypothetical protein
MIKGKKTRVTSKYAVSYKATGIIDFAAKCKKLLRRKEWTKN